MTEHTSSNHDISTKKPVTQPRQAAAVMVLRNQKSAEPGIEVFMVRRAAQNTFMPDVYVFPGGSVSTDDHNIEQTANLCQEVPYTQNDPEGYTILGNGVRAAAIRELFEEANILLAYHENKMLAVNTETAIRFDTYRQAFNQRKGSLLEMARTERLVLATASLRYFAHWITPDSLPKRFDTHFFITMAPEEQEAMYDQLETSDGIWIQPSVALQRFQQQQFPLAFPTYHQLQDLAAFHSVEEALDVCSTRSVPTHMPIMVEKDGKKYIQLPEDPDPDSYWIA